MAHEHELTNRVDLTDFANIAGVAVCVIHRRQQPPQIAGQIAFDWDSFTVFEEDEEVYVHPRDRYTRIDVLRSSRSVRVTVDDVMIAESSRPSMLLESGLSVRWYLPPDTRPAPQACRQR